MVISRFVINALVREPKYKTIAIAMVRRDLVTIYAVTCIIAIAAAVDDKSFVCLIVCSVYIVNYFPTQALVNFSTCRLSTTIIRAPFMATGARRLFPVCTLAMAWATPAMFMFRAGSGGRRRGRERSEAGELWDTLYLGQSNIYQGVSEG